MLARMGDEEVGVVITIMVFGALITWLALRAKTRSERLRVIEKALQSGNVDDDLKRGLLEALADRGNSDTAWWRGLNQHLMFLSRNLVFIGGWIAMFVGIGMCVSAFAFRNHYLAEGGVITALVGFGLATIPHALRELNGRPTMREPRR